jgi:cytochrome c2
MKYRLLLLLMVFSGCVQAAGATLTLKKNELIVKALSLNELSQATNLTTLTVTNPADSKITSYQGVLLSTLLGQVFGESWKQSEAIKFVAEDGYRVIIPTALISIHTGLIATGETGQHGFKRIQRDNKESIDPGPFFLVWENIQDTRAKKEHWLSWPWQLSSIELTTFAKENPNSAPPENSDVKAKQGFLDFQQHCIKCHTINGDGGHIGPELNFPANVTEYWHEDWLKRFINDPQSVRANSKMIPFYRDVENREQIIKSILVYLKAMKDKKIAP